MSDDSTRTCRVIAVVGPTAAGKTDLAERLADSLRGQIVSADSMQVYRGMDVGTAKPPTERRSIYHCIDIADPGEEYSAARFQIDARRAIAAISDGAMQPFVVGGTGLYVRAALDDWDIPSGHTDTPTRRKIEALLEEVGPQALHDRLAEADPEAARALHPNDSRRVVRALEMHEEGVSYAQQAARFSRRTSIYDTSFIGVSRDREELYSRIEDRVDRMLSSGLLDEVGALMEAGLADALTAGQAIGYKELVPVVRGESPLDEAIALIKQATRRYAKRQLTWFRADPRIEWLDATGRDACELLDEALGLVSSAGPGMEVS